MVGLEDDFKMKEIMRGKEGFEKGWGWLLVYVNGKGKGEVSGLLKERDINDGRMMKWMWEKGY